MDEGSPAEVPSNPATVTGVAFGSILVVESLLITQLPFLLTSFARFIATAGAICCWLIYLTARQTRSKLITAAVGIGTIVLVPLASLALAALYAAA